MKMIEFPGSLASAQGDGNKQKRGPLIRCEEAGSASTFEFKGPVAARERVYRGPAAPELYQGMS